MSSPDFTCTVIASGLLSCLLIVAVFFLTTLGGMAGGCSMLSWRLSWRLLC